MEINQTLQTFLFAITGILVVGSPAFFFVIRAKQQQEKARLQDKILSLESELLTIQQQKNQKQSPVRKKSSDSSLQVTEELMQLRKESASFKEDMKRLKREFEEKTASHLEKNEVLERQASILREENDALTKQFREMHAQDRSKTPAVSAVPAADVSSQYLEKAENHRLKRTLSEMEKKMKALEEKNVQLKDMNRQIVLWRERALAGKNFYRMMKNMRELSEEKLMNYQQSVLNLAEYVLKEQPELIPEVKQGENAVDRYLAAALSAAQNRRPQHP